MIPNIFPGAYSAPTAGGSLRSELSFAGFQGFFFKGHSHA